VLHLDGPVTVHRRIRNGEDSRVIPPGGMFMVPGNMDLGVRLAGTLRTLHLHVRRALLEEVADCLLTGDPSHIETLPRFGDSDPLLEHLLLGLRDALRDENPSATPYVDHLGRAIAARLLRHHSSAAPARQRNGLPARMASLQLNIANALDPLAWSDPPFEALADGDRSIAAALMLARVLRRCRYRGQDTRPAHQRPAEPGSLRRLVAGDRIKTGGPAAAVRSAGRAGYPAAAPGGERGTELDRIWHRRSADPGAGAPPRRGTAGAHQGCGTRCFPRFGRPILPWVSATTCQPCAAMPRTVCSGRPQGHLAGGLPAPGRRQRPVRSARARADPKALAATLRVAPQTATALLRALQEKGVIREVTGRGSFRAFAM
jgi:hypothetical protein